MEPGSSTTPIATQARKVQSLRERGVDCDLSTVRHSFSNNEKGSPPGHEKLSARITIACAKATIECLPRRFSLSTLTADHLPLPTVAVGATLKGNRYPFSA